MKEKAQAAKEAMLQIISQREEELVTETQAFNALVETLAQLIEAVEQVA